MPESLKCLCQIANDRPLGAGADEGVPGKTWLTAQAKYAAQVMRDEELAGAADHRPSLSRAHRLLVLVGAAVLELRGAARRAGAVSGPDAYKAVARTFITALRSEPGMDEPGCSPTRRIGCSRKERSEPFTPPRRR